MTFRILPLLFFAALLGTFSVQEGAAQTREICSRIKEQRGTLLLVAKNSGWFVNRAHPPKVSLSLWFRRSLTSRDMPDLVESGIQAYPAIDDVEKSSKGVGNEVKVVLRFDRKESFEFSTVLNRKTSKGEVYYWMPWMKILSEVQHAALIETAQRSSVVEIAIVGSNTGNVLRTSVQSLEGFADVVAEADLEHRRLLRAQPLGTCSTS